tara:strand:- start:811 stop:1197 length:387 start_codon:yes stop_codon:yes gene_type:complete
MTTHEVLELIDNNKEKLTDEVYKQLCDELAELNKKKKTKYARCEGVMVRPEMSCCEDHYELNDEGVKLLLTIDDEDVGDGYNFLSGRVSTKCFEDSVESIKKRGYSRHHYDLRHESFIIITKLEMLEV